MTREEAIKRLEFLKGVYSVDTETALDMAISALSKVDNAENPKCDLISRADAMGAVQALKVEEWDGGDYAYNAGLETAIRTLSTLPSADAIQGWIPCSEKLPSESGTYLVTTAKGAVWADHFYANSIDDRHWSYRTRRVPIAWMPLPKPYTKGDNE